MSKKKHREHEVRTKFSGTDTGVTKMKNVPKDNAPGRDISETVDKNLSGGSGALTKPPSWNK